MDDDYYSINSILADNHKLTCTFTLDVPGLGYIDGGNEPDIKQHAKAELPFWLAQTLSYNEWTTFPIPQPYSHRVRQALNASSRNVKLSSLVGTNGWWYAWGRRIAYILDDQQRQDLLAALSRAFSHRLGLIHDLGSHSGASLTSLDHDSALAGSGGGNTATTAAGGGLIFGEEFKEGMDAEERELYVQSQDASRWLKSWYDQPVGRNHKNR